jgi:transposase
VAAIASQAKEQRQLTDEQRQDVYRAYALIAQYAQQQLFSQAGAASLDYLHRRGLNDDTIRSCGLGYLPDGDNREMSSWLWRTDEEAYHAAALGGITARQGRLLNLARNSILFPYVALVDAESGQTETRMLRFRSMQGRGYRSPAGVAMFAGGTPCLFNGHSISQDGTVLLTEGELKALAAQQAGIPAVAQPGIGYLPDGMIAQLAGRRVILCYDSEERKDPFTLSPGESFTTRNGERLTATKQRRRLWYLDNLKEKELTDELKAEREALQAEIGGIEALAIRLQVARLPRLADEQKVDIDSYALAHGAEALQQVVNAAQPFELWYQRHSGQGYRYHEGGIHNGKPLANYQARVTEHITVSDGQSESIVFRLAARTPSGALRYTDIEQATWADNRAALQALRCAAGEATATDEGLDTLKAVKILSNQGDAPAPRRVYTATGWEQIDGRWHYLTKDGATHSQGVSLAYRADIDAAAIGNHYALCADEGSAGEGWAAWKRFLFGDVCPQPLALLLAGQAALSLLHRFTGNADRPLLWLAAESGALKTSLTRAGVLALWGAAFTAPRGAGSPVSKWDATGAGLEYTAFYYRDAPLLIDDYKQGVIHDGQFKRFLHNYSEGTGRLRGTKSRTLDKIMPARAIAISTGEDTPGDGDSGITARITTLPLYTGDVNPDNLAELQAAGAAGHLVAFWRGFVQAIATALDSHGADGLQALLQQRIAEDDDTLPGHKRASGALRQNRAAWLLLSGWLQQAGYLTADERAALDTAHLQARVNLAAQQAAQQRQNRPATIFLQLVDSLLHQGYIIEEKEMRCPDCGGPMHKEATGWHCGNDTLGDSKGVCHSKISADRLLGFRTASGQIGLYINQCWALAQELRRKQGQRLSFSLQAILQQLDSDGLIARKNKDSYTTSARHPATGKNTGCLLLSPAAFITPDSPDDQADDTGGQGGGQVDEGEAGNSGTGGQECLRCSRDVQGKNENLEHTNNPAESPMYVDVQDVQDVQGNLYIHEAEHEQEAESKMPHVSNDTLNTLNILNKGDTLDTEAKQQAGATLNNLEQVQGTLNNAAPAAPAPARPGADNSSGDPRQADERGSQADSGTTKVNAIRRPRRIAAPAPQPGTSSQPSERLRDGDISLPPGWELCWVASTALWQAQHKESGLRTSVHPRTRQGRAALLQDIRKAAERGAA